MEHDLRGLSEEQQNDCRAALQEFLVRHAVSEWRMTVKVQEATPGKFSVKIEMTPPPESGLPALPLQEIAVADASFDVAAEVDKMLERAWQDRFRKERAPHDSSCPQRHRDRDGVASAGARILEVRLLTDQASRASHND